MLKLLLLFLLANECSPIRGRIGDFDVMWDGVTVVSPFGGTVTVSILHSVRKTTTSLGKEGEGIKIVENGTHIHTHAHAQIQTKVGVKKRFVTSSES
jgi:hypothetical protein